MDLDLDLDLDLAVAGLVTSLLIITSNGDEIYKSVNIDDFE